MSRENGNSGSRLDLLRRTLPPGVEEFLRNARRAWYGTRFGRARLGSLRRVHPLDANYGFGRGTPIDRYYVDGFLERHAPDVRGRVVEIKDSTYTRKLGGARVTGSEVLDIDATNPHATIVADLAEAGCLPAESFDCIIVTQTLQLIYDVRSATRNIYEALKPGGVALVTVPQICRIGRDELDYWCWTFSALSIRRMFGEFFADDEMDIRAFGNPLVAAAFVHGVALEELDSHEVEHHEPGFEICITFRGVKGASG